MTTREDEAEAIVGDAAHVAVVRVRLELRQACQQLRLPRKAALTADPIDRAVPRGRDEPRAGILRRPVVPPALDRDCECVLDRVLGELEVTEDADEDRDGAAPFLTEQGLDG
jgi:hypothetical protein